MKKIHMISALLTLLPTVLLAGSGDKHYYAALKVSVKSGAGTVYAATSSTAESNRNYSKNGNTTSTVDSKNAAGGSVGTFYAYAKPDVGWKFVKWTNTSGKLVSEKAEYGSFTLVASSVKDQTQTTEYQAYFEQLPPATITFAAPVNGSYTVNNEAVSAQLVKSNQSVPYSVTLAATPAENFRFGGWYTEKNGEKTIFSTELTATKKFNEDTTVGALFIPNGFAIYAAVAGKGYNSLSEALSEAESGEAITIFNNVTLSESALVRVGVTLTVSSGVTLTVNGTLTVAGKLVNEGTVNGSGTLRKISYLIDQNEQNLQILHAPDGSEYGEITETHHDGIKPRYYKTKVTIWTPSVSGTINTATQAWGILLNGENVYAINAQSVKGVSVTLNTSIAVNKIASITGSLTSTEIQKGDTSSSKNWVVFGDCSLKGPAHTSDNNRLNFQGTIDLCGNTLTFGLGRTYSDFAPLILNGKVSFTPETDFQNAAGVFFNCSSVKITNIKGKCYFHFYDCGSEASLADLVFGYQSSAYRYAHVYGGYYKFGIESSSLFSSSTTYGFNSGQDLNYVKIYGGSFLDDPSDYRENKNTLVVLNPNSENNSSEYYLVTSLTSPAQKVAKINDKEYASLQTAINEANANETIVLINPCDFESTTIQIPQEKSITLSLDGYALSGSKIVNNGALTITDSTTGVGLSNTDVSSGIVSCGIENYGTLDLVFGSYSGAIVNKSGGTLTTHNGLFTGTLAKDAGTVNLRGGHFTADVTALATLPNSKVFHMNNLYTVCEVPNGTMYDTTVKGMAGYGATPYPVTDDHTLLKTRYVSNKSGRSDYSANNWKRLAELMAFYQLFNNHGLDPTLVFDRYVVKDSVNLAAASGSSEQYSELYLDVPAGTPYRALTEKLIRGTNPATGKPWTSKTYKAILEEDLTSVAVAVTDKGASGNAGTLCKAMIELWESERAQDYSSTGHKITNTVYVAGQKLFTLGAGSNKAMIRPATGAATFYQNLSGENSAVAAAIAGSNKKIMLANDCSQNLALTSAGTYTFDTMGFAYTGGEPTVDEGLFIKEATDAVSEAKIIVPEAVATTYVVAQKVASVGGTFYDNLAEAVASANGATVTLYAATDETITLGDGQSFALDKNGITFDDAKVVTSIEGTSVKAVTAEGVTTYSVVKDVVSSGGTNYPSIEAAVAAAEGNTVAVTVIAADTETLALDAGKTLTVTVADGVTAEVTVNPAEGAFIETFIEGTTTTYVSKKITVEMAEPQAAVEVTKIENGTESEVTDAAEISAAVTTLTGNGDVPRTDNIDKLDVLDKITVTPTKIVLRRAGDSVPYRIVKATFDVTPNLNAGQTLAEGQKLKFRLPVDPAATQSGALVYHGDALIGTYAVRTYNEEKFIEVESDSFSPYGYTLLDGETANPVAAIGTTGYASLADAVAAAQNGDTITLLADDTVSLTSGALLTIDKSITIAGAVDANGEPLYTISGTPTQTGTNIIYIDGSGTVTLSDLKIAGFGNDHATDASHAPVYVASTFTGTVNLDNLYISDFNRGGLFLYGGTFNVTNCYIDCANSRSGAFTKGIEIRNAAAGTIADTTIVNMTSESEDSVVCGVEFYGNGDVTVSGCTIEGDSWGAVGIGTAGFTDATTTGTITVEDCEITVYYAALYASVLGEGLGENRTTIKVTGGDYTADNYAVSALYGTVEIEDGLFSGMLEVGDSEYDENGSLSISGGLFEDEILAEYCAEGYIPSPQDPVTGLYTVIACILYPTGNTAAGLATAGVPIPDSWIAANGVTGETAEEKIAALGQNGANGVPKWQSYVLGLNPNAAASRLVLDGGKAAADGTVTITGLNVALPATLDAATTVGFHLEEATPADAAADKWTVRAEACVMAEGKPTFTVSAEAVSGKVLRIVADIKTEAK